MKNVRNFWIDMDVDGRANGVHTGPSKADGGFDITIHMRDDDEPVVALRVLGFAKSDGTLVLSVQDDSGEHFRKETQRVEVKQVVK